VRGYDASVGVVAVPGELVKQVFSVGLNVPIVVGLVTHAKVGYRVGSYDSFAIAFPCTAALAFVRNLEAGCNRSMVNGDVYVEFGRTR